MLYDNHGRKLDYMRLAVTDRCNLRCFYCMPEKGIDYVDRKDLLSYEEMLRLTNIMIGMGISKIRITGGEPFVRRDIMPFLRELSRLDGLDQIHITTNGTLTLPHIQELKELGIAGINLSLDTIDRKRFEKITRRDRLPEVMKTLNALLESGIPTKINMVVMEQHNTDDIIPMAELTRDNKLELRYIEEMPFNGSGRTPELNWNYQKILQTLQGSYPELMPLPTAKSGTSSNYAIPGYAGKLGIIAAYSRTFCGTCNRIRVTPQGSLRTCLYGNPVLELRELLRSHSDDAKIEALLKGVFMQRAKDGFEAEAQRKENFQIATESMSSIGG